MLVKSNYLPVDQNFLLTLKENDVVTMVQRTLIKQLTQKIVRNSNLVNVPDFADSYEPINVESAEFANRIIEKRVTSVDVEGLRS